MHNAKTKTQISFAVTAKLISTFVFATLIVQFLYFLNPNFPASSHLLCLYSLVCVGPVQKPHCWFSNEAAYIYIWFDSRSRNNRFLYANSVCLYNFLYHAVLCFLNIYIHICIWGAWSPSGKVSDFEPYLCQVVSLSNIPNSKTSFV